MFLFYKEIFTISGYPSWWCVTDRGQGSSINSIPYTPKEKGYKLAGRGTLQEAQKFFYLFVCLFNFLN